MGKGRPFLEVFASALHEDYRFPILEIFAFLYALGTFVFASFGSSMGIQAVSNESIAYILTASLYLPHPYLQKRRLRFGERPRKRCLSNLLFISS
jgi:hypothetical protein